MLERSGLTDIDVLSLDVEGHEAEVLAGRAPLRLHAQRTACTLLPALSPRAHSFTPNIRGSEAVRARP